MQDRERFEKCFDTIERNLLVGQTGTTLLPWEGAIVASLCLRRVTFVAWAREMVWQIEISQNRWRCYRISLVSKLNYYPEAFSADNGLFELHII